MDPYTQPYTRPFAAYSRNSPVKSTPDQTPSSYSHNRPITTYADQKDNRTATGLAYGNQTSAHVVEERRSIKRYSPTEADNSVTKPSKISKENDVLARANEVLQRSLRLTNPVNSGDSNPPARSHTPTPTTTTTVSPPVQQNVNNRTLDILNRANAILNKSTNYSKDPAAHVTTDRTNLSKTVTSFNRADFAVKETSIPTQSDNYHEEPVVNTRIVAAPAEKTTTNPRNLLSRIDQALQNSNQISANPNPNPYEPKPYSQNQYLSPQKSQYDYRSPQKSTGKNFKASEYAMRGQGQGLQEAYHDALRRSQEIVERNVEELMRSDHKRQHLSGNKNLKSSYVMERKTGYDDEQEQGEDVAAPGIYLPAQGIKPKFVEEYYEDGTIYKGEKIRTAKHGRGEFLYEDNSKYEGEWENDRKNGYGVQTFPNGTIQYDGEWKDDVYHGNGILMNGDAKEESGFDYNNFDTLENSWIKYEGEFMNGKMHGLGTLTLFNNERYVGKFKYDQVHGAGVFHKRNGETVSGEWENSKFARNL